MNDTKTTGTPAPASPVVLEDERHAGVPRARDVARAFADSLDPALDAETAEILALVCPNSPPTHCATAAATTPSNSAPPLQR
jgi:hypothetical protein